MRYWDKMRETTEGPFTIVVDKSWEDACIRDHFDESCNDIEELERKVNDGTYDWFMLRARVLLEGVELGEHIVGGFLYEDADEVFEDGMADDVVYGAKCEAREWILRTKELDLEALI